MNPVSIEIVGYKDSECSPFPCDEERSCGLTACLPSNSLIQATEALRLKLKEEFHDHVQVTLILLDEGVPENIRLLYEEHHPVIPIILINGTFAPIGRISYKPIRDAVQKVLTV